MILTVTEINLLKSSQDPELIFSNKPVATIPRNRTNLIGYIGQEITMTTNHALISIKERVKFYTPQAIDPLNYSGIFAPGSMYQLNQGETLGLSSDAGGYRVTITLE